MQSDSKDNWKVDHTFTVGNIITIVIAISSILMGFTNAELKLTEHDKIIRDIIELQKQILKVQAEDHTDIQILKEQRKNK